MNLDDGERINAILPIKDFETGGYVHGDCQRHRKKTLLKDFSRPRSAGIIAVDLVEDDALVGAALTDGERDLMLFSTGGKAIRFNEKTSDRWDASRGVRGMELAAVRVVTLLVADVGMVLTATEHGYGKCTVVEEYRAQGRGKGLISIQTNDRNGGVVVPMVTRSTRSC